MFLSFFYILVEKIDKYTKKIIVSIKMGHIIEIVNMITNETITDLYYTANWTKDVCFQVDKWKLPYMFHGHYGELIAKKLLEILKEFEDVEENDNILDGWGQFHEFISKQFQCRQDIWYREKFKKILKQFLEIAEKYPDYYWYSDQVWNISELDGESGSYRTDDENTSDENLVNSSHLDCKDCKGCNNTINDVCIFNGYHYYCIRCKGSNSNSDGVYIFNNFHFACTQLE